MQLSHILCPTDFSAGSEAAFQTAITLARESGAQLTLLHVHHVPTTAFPDMFFMTPDLLQETERSVDSHLDQLVSRARADGVVATPCTVFGTTHREICALAAERGVDLIVMGSHGHPSLFDAFHTSVAERVVRHAPCPVLTVHPHEALAASP
jgi:nucleotide-binding universal stress UspA family protein